MLALRFCASESVRSQKGYFSCRSFGACCPYFGPNEKQYTYIVSVVLKFNFVLFYIS